jgi:hypothetical protein
MRSQFFLKKILKEMSLPYASADVLRVVVLLKDRSIINESDISKGFDDNTLDDISIRLKIADGTIGRNLIALKKKLNIV